MSDSASYTQVTGKLDLINRQDAIDSLETGAELLKRVLDNTDIVGSEREKFAWGLGLVESFIEDIKGIPSAQPKTVLVAEVKLSKEQIQDAIDKAVEKMKAELEPCDFCKHKDDCGDMALYCPSERRTDEQTVSE